MHYCKSLTHSYQEPNLTRTAPCDHHSAFHQTSPSPSMLLALFSRSSNAGIQFYHRNSKHTQGTSPSTTQHHNLPPPAYTLLISSLKYSYFALYYDPWSVLQRHHHSSKRAQNHYQQWKCMTRRASTSSTTIFRRSSKRKKSNPCPLLK